MSPSTIDVRTATLMICCSGRYRGGRRATLQRANRGRTVDGAGQLRVSLLGELTAWYDEHPLDLGGPRQRAVLGLLLLARGESVRTERLIELLWADQPPANGVAVLQSYVSHLRRRMQPGSAARTRSAVIVRESHGYAVRLPADAVDTWRFEALLGSARAERRPDRVAAELQDALALWRGPALADYTDEPWAAAEIARLTELRAVARELLAAARLELGDAALVVPELEAMTAEEPLREERWRLLALALYRAHRQPGPTAPEDLHDRDRELSAVRSALDDLVAGEPGLLLIEGPAASARPGCWSRPTRLAATRAVRVLAARGSRLENAFGFGVTRQLFEPELLATDRRADLLGGAAASARGVFDPGTENGAAAGSGEASFAILHGLYWLAVNLSRSGPLLLTVDDVQWWLPGLPGAPARGLAGAGCRHRAHRRARGRGPGRRAGPRPGGLVVRPAGGLTVSRCDGRALDRTSARAKARGPVSREGMQP